MNLIPTALNCLQISAIASNAHLDISSTTTDTVNPTTLLTNAKPSTLKLVSVSHVLMGTFWPNPKSVSKKFASVLSMTNPSHSASNAPRVTMSKAVNATRVTSNAKSMMLKPATVTSASLGIFSLTISAFSLLSGQTDTVQNMLIPIVPNVFKEVTCSIIGAER